MQPVTDQEREEFLRRQGAYRKDLTEEQRQAIRDEWSNDEEVLMAIEMGG